MPRRFNTRKFIKDVLEDKYALVIGNEVVLDEKVDPTRDVHQYLLKKVNEVSNEQYENYYEIALDKKERINPIRQLLDSGEIEFDARQVSSELMGLLETKLFTTILTTTTDGYLEAAMRKVWGTELRVVNIYDKETLDDFQNERKNYRKGKKYNKPTLIYVFGKIDIENWDKKYVRTEIDAIRLIEKWMRMNIESNNEMLEYIRSKRLLALGCKYDNWYFRFFWYVLTRDIDDVTFEGKGEVAFTLDSSIQSDSHLQAFLDYTNICVLGDAISFITDITKILTEDTEESPFRQQIVESRRRGGIFISYCSQNALSACQLFFQLREKKYDVWLDNSRLYGGDDYENEISDAISESKVFIALLSPQIAEDLKNNDTDHYYNKEWHMAQQFNDKTIIPLAINGYNLRSEYHQGFEAIVNQKPSGIDLMEADGFHKLITSINEHL